MTGRRRQSAPLFQAKRRLRGAGIPTPSARALIEEQRNKVRAALRARVADSGLLDEAGRRSLQADLELHRLTEEAWTRADAEETQTAILLGDTARPIGAKLAYATRVAAGEKAPRVRLLEGDQHRFRRKANDYDWKAIDAAAQKAAAARQKGDPAEGTIKSVWRYLKDAARYTAGKVQEPFKTISRGTGWCIDTVFEVVQYLERTGVLDVESTRARGVDKHGNPGVFRGVNIYVLRLPEPEDAPAQEDAPSVLARYAARVRRAVAWFDLAARETGFLNTSPLAVRAAPEPT